MPRSARRTARAWTFVGLALGLAGLLAAGCGLVAPSPPEGAPLNPCPVAGPGAVTPREGYALVAPGEVVFAWEAWHDESPGDRSCGAQSVKGAKVEVSAAAIPAGEMPWAATLQRSAGQITPDHAEPTGRLFRLADSGPVVVERIQLGPRTALYGATGNLTELLRDPVPGRYRFVITSWQGEELATGEFELRP